MTKHDGGRLEEIAQMELPQWTDIVKTGTFKELAPYDRDWLYVCLCTNAHMHSGSLQGFMLLHIMAASMARKIYLRQGLGVGSFQRIYGGSRRNGSRPSHFCKSSGAVARHILQQLQKINIIDVEVKG
ncbi:hypothetical protein RHSIM_Rhsim10G0043900 [Rhododendron simsii]|uniref:40S ribosomal protein S19 n=1 Tax=Rhododendron simsii TaxID=118357 RepID=A0A834GBZ9_RHOSS|nr:hypothetical protein RHSIM_Rhsim10G0043900 [Rhododendron simsii]